MELAKIFFFKIIAPIIWLMVFAYVFAISSTKLAKAWEAKNVKQIWLYIWIILVGLYFLIFGGKS